MCLLIANHEGEIKKTQLLYSKKRERERKGGEAQLQKEEISAITTATAFEATDDSKI